MARRKVVRSYPPFLLNKCVKRRSTMRFTEIANPEDQLALWRMVSDSMWKVFGQASPTTQPNNTQHAQPNPINAVKPIATPRPTVEPLAKGMHRIASIRKPAGKPAKPSKLPKPKKAPMTQYLSHYPSRSHWHPHPCRSRISNKNHNKITRPICTKS